MDPKPPPLKAGDAGLAAFREAIKLYETTLKNRWSREFHRKDLARWLKLYATLASKRDPEDASAAHFSRVSRLCAELLDEYGPEPPPKKRAKKQYTPVPLCYPDFPDHLTHRLHFLEGPGIRRQRAMDFIRTTAVSSRQTSGTGRVLVSVGLPANEVRFFERLVEIIGDKFAMRFKSAGFDEGYTMKPEDVAPGETWSPNHTDPKLPLARIREDNHNARRYLWQSRDIEPQTVGGYEFGRPPDLPSDIGKTLWDCEARWQEVLNLTEVNDLQEAASLIDQIPGHEREILFDEVIYLRFLTDGKVRADDIRFLARKYAENSLISGRLTEEFDAFLGYLGQSLEETPPILSKIGRLDPEFGSGMIPVPPPASDWMAYKEYASSFTTPGGPRGRIFSINIDIGLGSCVDAFASNMVEADNAFRRDRGIPEIGRGWVSEVALLDLIRSTWPSAVHQWRPHFLGMQSIDIYVPDLKLAVEYQGQQHYEPIDLFGGEEGLALTQARDEKKRMLLQANNVQLMEWPYHAPITFSELKGRMTDIGVKLPEESAPPTFER